MTTTPDTTATVALVTAARACTTAELPPEAARDAAEGLRRVLAALPAATSATDRALRRRLDDAATELHRPAA